MSIDSRSHLLPASTALDVFARQLGLYAASSAALGVATFLGALCGRVCAGPGPDSGSALVSLGAAIGFAIMALVLFALRRRIADGLAQIIPPSA